MSLKVCDLRPVEWGCWVYYGFAGGCQFDGSSWSILLAGWVLIEDIAEVCVWIDVVELAACYKAVDNRCPPCPVIASGEEVVLASDHHHPKRPFREVIVDLENRVGSIFAQRIPLVQRVCDRLTHRAFGQHFVFLIINRTLNIFKHGNRFPLPCTEQLGGREFFSLGAFFYRVELSPQRHNMRSPDGIAVYRVLKLPARMSAAADFGSLTGSEEFIVSAVWVLSHHTIGKHRETVEAAAHICRHLPACKTPEPKDRSPPTYQQPRPKTAAV